MEKLNNKNFWIPLLMGSFISFIILFFGIPYILYLSLKIVLTNVQSYQQFLLVSLFALPIFLVLAIPPVFFIIKRLLSKKPKKLFYFELPILVIIYSVVLNLNQLFGLMMGGPIDTTFSRFLSLIIPQLVFVIVWLVLLSVSLYFYYKKKIIKHSSSKVL